MNESLELKYKEMVRLAEKIDEYAKSSFDDFKMLSALGVLLAWKPISDMSVDAPKEFLLIGFMATLFVIAFIALFGLLKQSIANFYLKEIQVFEKEVRDELKDSNMQTFRVAENWIKRGSKIQRKAAKRFYLLFYVVIIMYPTTILWLEDEHLAIIYLVSALFVTGLHLNTTKLVYGESKLKNAITNKDR